MTATASKPREVTYYKIVGGAAGPQLKLTDSSTKPLLKALEVLEIHAKDSKNFPLALELAQRLTSYLKNPQRTSVVDQPPPPVPPGAGRNSVG
jgi:hypothetical protein